LKDLLDLKQKQASVTEARSARKDAKASSKEAEASAKLSYETFKQGGSIMIFTIITIIFLPLSFFTSLFGMNAKELISGDLSIGLYSEIMFPVSFIVICLSLGLALDMDFRLLVFRGWRKFLKWIGLSRIWKRMFSKDTIMESIERERRDNDFNRWKAGF